MRAISTLIAFCAIIGVSAAYAEDPAPTPIQSEPRAQTKWPDCYCTDRNGKRIELGIEICMRVDGRSFLARCAMSLNTPSWKEIEGNCQDLPSS